MRIAVVGSGISGLASAWLLAREHRVTLFEGNTYFGGHTHTHEVEQEGLRYRIDSGFIVHNPRNYPLLTRLFDQLGVASHDTTMGFSVHCERSGLEYNTATLDALFCQRRNLVAPRFLGMVRDLLRFYREAPALLCEPGEACTLQDYLAEHRYGAAFRDDHLIPMACALWSSPAARILHFPARYLVQFMANHQMLQVSARSSWRVVTGGSSTYVRALRERWPVEERLNCAVHSIRRLAGGVQVASAAGTEQFDQVVLACHADQALALLRDPDDREQSILSAIRYQSNDTVLHTDAAVLPSRRKAWAAWNAWVPRAPDAPCTVSYCMNLLQGIQSPRPFVVTLNRADAVDPGKVLARMHYRHPEYSLESVAAQRRKAEIQGKRCTWFAGAYWGWGFHEDGMKSATDVADALGCRWPSIVRSAQEPPTAGRDLAA